MFWDLDDREIMQFRFPIESGATKTMQLKTDCESGKTLLCSSVPNLLVEGKHTSSGTWINLETTGIDLTTWDGTIETFDIRFTADNLSSYSLENFFLYKS